MTSEKPGLEMVIPSHLEEFNILMLGETGAGKSTTINAIANYLKFANFEDAMEGEFINLIPLKFHLPNPDNYEETIEIVQGKEDENELFVVTGDACTQSPMGYLFRIGNALVRIIDTPGLGDPRGVATDKSNFDKVLYYIRHHRKLSGICILLKAGQSRLTNFYTYIIGELFARLPKNALPNIVFCFTYSRIVDYLPDSGFHMLKKFIANLPHKGKLEVQPFKNCFFIDNEAFRFLVANKQGYPLDNLDKYKEAWDKSSKQVGDMIQHLIKLEPHQVRHTTALDSTRKMLTKLAEPMVEVELAIKENIDSIRNKLDQLTLERKLKEPKAKPRLSLKPKSSFEVVDVVMEPVDVPRLVCTSKNCVIVVKDKEVNKTVCHRHCKMEDIETNIIGDPRIQRCKVFDHGRSQTCLKCGCSWELHKHHAWRYRKVLRALPPKPAPTEQEQGQDECQEVIDLIREYQHEQKVIQEVASKFGIYLRANSTFLYNAYIDNYLRILIEEEEGKLNKHVGQDRKKLKSLLEMRKEHQEAIERLQSAQNSDSESSEVTVADVDKCRDQLLNLKHSGSSFRDMINAAIAQQKEGFQYMEKVALEIN